MARQLDIVRASFGDFNARRHDAWIAYWADDVVLHELPEIPDHDLYVGPEGVRQWLENMRTVLGDPRFEPRVLEEHGDYVLVGVEARGASAGAGVPLEWQPWIVFRFRGDQVAECWGFLNEDQARAQVGAAGSGADPVG
jgi:ketosteroid isomerase-like protein